MFDHGPQNWRDLQIMVAQAFQEMGCDAHIEKKITIARGTVNVDVYVIDRSQSPTLIYICECKHWSKKVPKTTIHSFRSVVSDSGSHLGLIISSRGFQSGAYSSAIHSNIKLYSWHEFVQAYENRWTNAILKRLDDHADALQAYCLNPIENAEHFPSKDQPYDSFIQSWTENYKRAGYIRAIWINISSAISRNEFPTKFYNLDIPNSDEWVTIHSKREGYEYLLPRQLSCRHTFERLAGKLRK